MLMLRPGVVFLLLRRNSVGRFVLDRMRDWQNATLRTLDEDVDQTLISVEPFLYIYSTKDV